MIAIARIEQGHTELLVEVLCTIPRLGGFYPCVDLFTDTGYTIYQQNITMIEDNQNIPQRFSRETFFRVATHIGEALRKYPTAVTVHSSLSANTLARLVQEALRAKRLYHWRHPDIDEQKWLMYEKDLGTTRIGEHTIQIGSAASFMKTKTPAEIVTKEDTSPVPPIYVTVKSYTDLQHIAALLVSHALSPQPRFVVAGSSPEMRTQLEHNYDIVFTPHESDPALFHLI